MPSTMPDGQYRAVVDGAVTFANGGDIAVRGFRLDVASPDIGRADVGRALVRALGLLMADDVRLDAVEIVEEPHKGTRGGPSDVTAAPEHGSGAGARLVDLSHPIRAGMVTLPGLPGPEITAHLTRDASRALYAEGTTFEIGRISMVANTGTYLDAPQHRFAEGVDLSGLALASLADVPATVVRLRDAGGRAIQPESLAAHAVAGCAVLLETGDSDRFGRPDYVENPAYLTRAGAQWLVDHGATLVGIDAANIDDMTDGTRPAHTLLLAAGIPIVEHLTGLDQVPVRGGRFFAVPPRVEGMATFPVRAFALVRA